MFSTLRGLERLPRAFGEGPRQSMRCEGSGFSAAHGVWSRLCYCWSLVTTRFPLVPRCTSCGGGFFPAGILSLSARSREKASAPLSYSTRTQRSGGLSVFLLCCHRGLCGKTSHKGETQRWEESCGAENLPVTNSIQPVSTWTSNFPSSRLLFPNFGQKAEVMGKHTKITFFWGSFFNTFSTNLSLGTRARTSCSH